MALFRRRRAEEARDIYPLSLDAWASQYFSFAGNLYGLGLRTTLTGNEISIEQNFPGFVRGAYKSNGVVFACMLARMLLFSEARFAYRKVHDGRPGDLHGGGLDARAPGVRDLGLLQTPWPNGTTGDLLTRMINDADLAGSFYGVRDGMRIRRLRPDWTTLVLDRDAREYDAEVVGYLFHPGGRDSGLAPDTFTVDQVAQFSPLPDPIATYRGMSWLTPVIREIGADSAMTDHRKAFFENGATVNLVVKTGEKNEDRFKTWVKLFREQHESVANAYKTLFLAEGAEATPVGADMRQIDFKTVQGAGETRIAAAAGMHPVIVGLSEGLQGSSLNAGNFQAARRLTADKAIRPLWRMAAGALASIIRVPTGSELWYDASDVAFLREDEKDAAEIQQVEAQSIKALIEGGYEADSVVDAVTARDWTRLKHTGLFSVQLQAPGSAKMPEGEAPGEQPVAGPQTGPVKPVVPLAPKVPNAVPANGKVPTPA